MFIEFYINDSPKNKIGKILDNIGLIEGSFRTSFDILYPEFDFQDTDGIYFPYVNYCYIDEFKKYYFINSIQNIRTGLFHAKCEVDVLETYKDKILDLQVVFRQNSNNKYYNGNSSSYDVRTDKEIYYLENNFNPEGTFVLTAINSNIL